MLQQLSNVRVPAGRYSAVQRSPKSEFDLHLVAIRIVLKHHIVQRGAFCQEEVHHLDAIWLVPSGCAMKQLTRISRAPVIEHELDDFEGRVVDRPRKRCDVQETSCIWVCSILQEPSGETYLLDSEPAKGQ